MKKIIFVIGIIFVFSLALPMVSFAQAPLETLSLTGQGMMGFINSSPDNTAIQSQKAEEQEGKNFLNKLTNKTITCLQLKDVDFDKIGEYFMGQSIGDISRHIIMNEMMKRMMGEQGEEQAHIVMGKRLSGCDTSAAFPSQDAGFIPMMGMMGNWQSYDDNNNYNQPYNFNSMMGSYFGNSMMGFGYGYGAGWLGVILMILFWVLVILAIVAFVSWLVKQARGITHDNGNQAIDILRERYAKGEINKEEFKAKKKDLS